MSKRDVCEEVLIYLAKNGFEDQARNWKGVEQQINRLEKKFRDALAFKDQTGQGVIEEAEELQRQVGDPGNDSEAENYVAQAKTKTKGNAVPTSMKLSRDSDLNMHAPSSDDESLPSDPGLSGEQTQSARTTQGPAVNQTPGNSQQQLRQPASSPNLQ
ncbi:hypothetical protein PCANC_09472 [Puccinia coronata f. sp. avenae]|uniref:Uncharacterized protein n=1 Tax=Puccinia coronata f. sp. avenae TaxID=200324 RepID=A0A2N5VVP2_9BASI|nr:hypothetical protein PCANC_09472 [Puccinia coronata f. sp. avenae]